MNKEILKAASKKITTWTASDGIMYGRDMKGNWIRLGYQTGMSDNHIIEYVAHLERIEGLSYD